MCKMETWLLEDHAEGLLGIAETTLLEAHLAVCEDCRRELSHIKLLFWEMESMRREPVPIPDALKGVENAVLDEWLADKESWLQRAGSQWRTAAKQTVALMPRIPGAAHVVEVAGNMYARTAKWMGRTTLRLIRQKLLPHLTGGGS